MLVVDENAMLFCLGTECVADEFGRRIDNQRNRQSVIVGAGS
jgi:hypothetical protein